MVKYETSFLDLKYTVGHRCCISISWLPFNGLYSQHFMIII